MKTSSNAGYLDSICDTVASGRRAARDIARLVSPFQLKEPEFRLLWCLKQGGQPIDQKQLAEQLVLSPAQVSALVEQLSKRGYISLQAAPGDRRRSLWRISDTGIKLLQEIENLTEWRPCSAEGTADAPRRLSA